MIAGQGFRVVFDTNVIVSALLFRNSRLSWLRSHWAGGYSVPLVSRFTIAELTRVLGSSKFKLSPEYRAQVLMQYLPYCQSVDPVQPSFVVCRDPNDQPFLDLAYSGKAHTLVTGDEDLLSLRDQTSFAIESPEQYQRRAAG